MFPLTVGMYRREVAKIDAEVNVKFADNPAALQAYYDFKHELYNRKSTAQLYGLLTGCVLAFIAVVVVMILALLGKFSS